MEDTELHIAGISIAKNVVSTVVRRSAEKVEGVARVGGNDIASNLVSVFTSRSLSPERSVESFVEDDKLHITIHLAVFYGYPFTKLADAVRQAVAKGISEQIGVETSAVDVCIDSLVFPKE
ncbi:MAG: Asp23/Gls24 family envelope stress response protein [Atopobiaceae bacterium]|nr:Asp23/Gls24 family envelope stress response protein [Atopobiaceae bacterium]